MLTKCIAEYLFDVFDDDVCPLRSLVEIVYACTHGDSSGPVTDEDLDGSLPESQEHARYLLSSGWATLGYFDRGGSMSAQFTFRPIPQNEIDTVLLQAESWAIFGSADMQGFALRATDHGMEALDDLLME